MSASAGRVLLIPKGTYDASTTYHSMDIVKYGVSSYVCKMESTGNLPTNTTYWQILAEGIANVSPEAIGIGYGVSSDSGSARTATLSDYNLTPNGIVAVTFGADVPANATLNINSQGAKPIYYRGSALVANVIRGGDTVTFAYDGTHYDILCIDGGAGHEIENSAGTKLTQRDVLAFKGGLKATDDSTNQKTLIDDTPDYISATDWDAKTDEEKNEYIASHNTFGILTHDSQGVINAEYMTKLWENPNTTQAFAGQTVTLSSADYDFLLVISRYNNSTGNDCSPIIVKKGDSGFITCADMDSNSSFSLLRAFTRNSDTSYTFSVALSRNTNTQDNTRLIPVAIYGIKTSVQFKVNAIASELSTRADHCFLDDEVTTVEDAITYKDVYSTDEHIIGKWVDGSTLYEKTVNYGALPNSGGKNVAHGISNLGFVTEIFGCAISADGIYRITFNPSYRYSNDYITALIDSTNVKTFTNANYSSYTTAYITVRYTKTS